MSDVEHDQMLSRPSYVLIPSYSPVAEGRDGQNATKKP